VLKGSFLMTAAKKNMKRKVLTGQPISPGVALGQAFVYTDILSRNILSYSIEAWETDKEIGRLDESIALVLKDLEKMRLTVKNDIGDSQANIFELHRALLQDDKLLRELKEELRKELVNAEQVVKNVFRKRIIKLRNAESEMIRSKTADLEDISRRLLRVLLGYEGNVLGKLPPGTIVVAKRLLPSDTVHLKRQSVEGIIVGEGSKYSHSAILSRALGVPALTGISDILAEVKNGDEILVDGDKSRAIVYPTAGDKKRYKLQDRINREIEIRLRQKAQKPALTKNGKKTKVYANIASAEDYEVAIRNGCDGIGLWRIEQIYLGSKIMPDEDYLRRHFLEVLSHCDNTLVTIRLLDIGGDKQLPYLYIGQQVDPSLGMRGIRILLKYEKLLLTQLKVIAEMSRTFNLRVLVPLVTFAHEIRTVRQLYESCRRQTGQQYSKSLKIGAMIETPAGVINLPEIIRYADFISIGTNDLIQYTLAAGRENPNVSEYYTEGARVILGMIRDVAGICNKNKKECSICGEISSDLLWTEELLKTGVTNYSVSPHMVSALKEKIRHCVAE
jgi:phosphoenolpyruvate-protein phosphotransferase